MYYQQGYLYDVLIAYATEYNADPDKHSKQIAEAFGKDVLRHPQCKEILNLYANDVKTSKDKSLGFFTLLALTPYYGGGDMDEITERCCKLASAELPPSIINNPKIIARIVETYGALTMLSTDAQILLAANIICSAYRSIIIGMIEKSVNDRIAVKHKVSLPDICSMARTTFISLWDEMYSIDINQKHKDLLRTQLLKILSPIQTAINTHYPKDRDGARFTEKVLSNLLASCMTEYDFYPNNDEFEANIKLIKNIVGGRYMTPSSLQEPHWGALHEVCRGIMYTTPRAEFRKALPCLLTVIAVIQIPFTTLKYPVHMKSFHNYMRYNYLQNKVKRLAHKAS